MKKEYKVVIFDLDGTLINSLPYHVKAFKELLAERNIKIKGKELEVLMGKPTTDIFRELRKKYGFKGDIHDLREERRYHYFKLIGNKDIIFDNSLRIINLLKKRYKIALATGSSYVIYFHSTSRDLQEIFNFTCTINDVKRGKPFPDQFIMVAKKLKVDNEECLVVGDSIYDALAAKRAGMDFVGILKGYTDRATLEKYGAIKVISDIRELTRIL